MKTKSYYLLIALLFFTISCNNKLKIVENPIFEVTNTNSVKISKAELHDTVTILHIDAMYIPKYWIRIVSDTYLKADGVKYKIIKGEGIKLDDEFWMPESGRASFSLYFEPLPKNTKSFDFIESDCEDCFKIYGIDLTGKKELPKYPVGLPEELKVQYKDSNIPEPVFESGNSKITLKLLGYREGLYKNIKLSESTIFSNEIIHDIDINQKSGIGYIEFDQHGSSNFYIIADNYIKQINIGDFWMAPGENIDIYVDLQEESVRRYQMEVDYEAALSNIKRPLIYTTGMYADLNYFSDVNLKGMYNYSMDVYSSDFIKYDVSREQYMSYIDSLYKNKLEKLIDNTECPGMIKEIKKLELKSQYLYSVLNNENILERNYRKENNDFDYSKSLEFSFAKLEPKDYNKVKELIDFHDTKFLMLKNYGLISTLFNSWDRCDNYIEPDNQFLQNFKLAIPLIHNAEQSEISREEIKELDKLNNKFFFKACSSIYNKRNKEIEELKDRVCILDIPKVDNSKLFDKIIAEHKGKVIVVDFWNTWCSPCRNSMEINEKYKSTEFNNDNIVWIYIANETSPKLSYMKFIDNIKGHHYRVNAEQWDYLCDKFNIHGIPSYVFVDKDGKYKLRDDFRNHSVMTSTIKEEVKKCINK